MGVILYVNFMSLKEVSFTEREIRDLADQHPTPFYVYDESGIIQGAQSLNAAFAWNSGYMNHFAAKALPNPDILKLLAQHGMGVDCSSLPELLLAEMAGLTGEQIFFTSNNTPADSFAEAKRLGAIVNFDDAALLAFYKEEFGELPQIGCARYNSWFAQKGKCHYW